MQNLGLDRAAEGLVEADSVDALAEAGIASLRTDRDLLRARRAGHLRSGILGGARARRCPGFDTFLSARLRQVWEEPLAEEIPCSPPGLEVNEEWMAQVVQGLWDWFAAVEPVQALCILPEPSNPPLGPPPPEPVRPVEGVNSTGTRARVSPMLPV